MAISMVTVMAIMNTRKTNFCDLHSHVLFGVDDGAKSIEDALELVHVALSKGINHLCLTPHVNSKESTADKTLQIRHFEQLKKATEQLPITLYLGAEIYLGDPFPTLDFKTLTLNDTHHVLVEFSSVVETDIVDYCYQLQLKGFQVIIAHIERYGYLTELDLIELKQLNVLFQVNASSLVSKAHKVFHQRAWHYLKLKLVDIVSSDAHNLTTRPFLIDEAYMRIKRKMNQVIAKDLCYETPLNCLIKSNH
jgi:protein-tyrosine phosphatase